MFKLYEGTGNQWHVHPLENLEVEGADGKAEKTFQDLKVLHQYECGVKVKTSRGNLTLPALKSKWTKMPQGIKSCSQPIIILYDTRRYSSTSILGNKSSQK